MKKIIYFITISTLCLCLFCCNNKKQEVTLYEVTQDADSVSFDKFITEFSSDKNFQFVHIIFPVEIFVPENQTFNTKDTTLYISKTQWKFLNLIDENQFPATEKVFYKTMKYESGLQ